MMNYEEPRDVQAGTPQLVGTVEDSNGDNNSTNKRTRHCNRNRTGTKLAQTSWSGAQNFNSNKQTKSKTILNTKSTNENRDYR